MQADVLDDPRQKLRSAELLLLLAVCVAFTLGAVKAFPTMDDGYLDLIVREQGPLGMLKGHPDRPLVALLLSSLLGLLGSHFWQFAFVAHAVLWTLLGIESSALWCVLVPSQRRYAVLVGLLAISPIVLQCQLCTAAITFTGLLSVVIAYLGLFALMRNSTSIARTVIGLALFAVAILICEYGVAAAGVAAVLLATRLSAQPFERRRQIVRVFGVVVVTIVAYAAFLRTADLGQRVSVDPRIRLGTLGSFQGFPTSLATRVWHVVLGAYGTSLGDVQASHESRSSIVAVLCGLAVALATVWVLRSSSSHGDSEEAGPARIGPLLLAVTVGLIPVALMRGELGIPFMTRLHIPVMPVAAVLTVACLLRVAGRPFHLPLSALFAFLAGMALFLMCWSAISRQKHMHSIGREIAGSVAPDGLTAVVLSTAGLCDSSSSCTAEATVGWPLDLEERTWIFHPNEGTKLFGNRVGCANPPDLDIDVRTVRRVGRVARLLWAQVDGDKVRIEPYCVLAVRWPRDPGSATDGGN